MHMATPSVSWAVHGRWVSMGCTWCWGAPSNSITRIVVLPPRQPRISCLWQELTALHLSAGARVLSMLAWGCQVVAGQSQHGPVVLPPRTALPP